MGLTAGSKLSHWKYPMPAAPGYGIKKCQWGSQLTLSINELWVYCSMHAIKYALIWSVCDVGH